MTERAPSLAEFDPLLLETCINWIQQKVRRSLPQEYSGRTETVRLMAGDRSSAQPILTYGAVARQFAAFVARRHHGIIEESGAAPTYPYGPIGLAADGMVVSLCKTPSGQVNLWAQSIDNGERFSGCWHNKHRPDDGLIAAERGARFVAASRALGEATLSPCMRPGRVGQFALVDISRVIDLSITDYQTAYPDAPIAPIGALTAGSTLPTPIFPLHALINLDVEF